MRTIETSVTIEADPQTVWKVFTDFDHYPDWNPFIRKVEGKIEKGSKVRVRIAPPGGKAMNFKPQIIRLEEGKELAWLGHLGMRGFFDGEHIFELHPVDENHTRFDHKEQFRGYLISAFSGSFYEKVRQGFEAMNEVIRERSEHVYSKKEKAD